MTPVILDTNVLISFLTDRSPAQQEKAATLFESAVQGNQQLILHQIVISEMVYVLGNHYGIKAQEVAQTIKDLIAIPNVRTVHEVTWNRVLDLWPSRVTDFADAVLADVALGRHQGPVATFDRRFVKQLRREGCAVFWN